MRYQFKFLVVLLFIFRTAAGQFSQEKIDELQTRLDALVSPLKSSGITVSAKVLHGEENKVLYEFQPEIKVIPASITKLVTATCAFSKLGQSYNFETVVYTDDNNISDGVINGNIYLKGFGDPDLNSSDIAYLASLVAKNNIKQITGNVVADESFLDNIYYGLSGTYKGDTGPSYWPYVNALALDKNKGYNSPSLSAADILSSNLKAAGLDVQGSVIAGKTPKGSKELCKMSHSIFDVISNMDKESDNHSAITVFKVLGAKLIDNPGSLEKGQQAVESFMNEIGVSRYSYEILEGSGLTRYNQVTADMYIKLLKYMYDDRFLFDYFFNSLSIAGKDGTLHSRMIGTEAEGNVHAKTGTLNSVSALTGYTIDRDNEILIFFIVMNGFGGNTNRMRAIQDDFCVTLAQFQRK